ncbi:hypothetical protein TrVFT333_007196 [Trichoderma virens FT-333]|nr:hypothetical protein TrVFT333_007196 [Trichoderma virens FT-333]
MKASRDGLLSNNSLYKIQEVLQEVEDDLGENLAKMQLWKRRQDRGLDRPRWTLKDEYRYGGAISRLQASNDFYMEELVRCRAKILAFNSQLTREIDAARSDWEMRTTNNAFPDFVIHAYGSIPMIAENDYVVVRWIGGGKHTGPAFDDLPIGRLPGQNTGRIIQFSGTTIYTLKDGKIVEEVAEEGALTALQQLGILSSARTSD